ncbi:exodeoxyribonuclease III [Methanothermobacter wolfeii]|uniref:Exodeoxyribonuclease III n=1 Tax=Methanothermobacter wolfeii TaxID=145261 RepID=A0A9E7RUC5_METWO|nr:MULTISPECIES: exodeoxyribonuclease III [Methanothermobacter]QHN06127.1 exodeoxyribonuclease III [Methanothermobacter sp. THM-1]UXH32328.1 exodeoxyribonuclease III [Methanothermobacter wolfeii]
MTVIRIISWNVNGLRAVYRKGFLDWFLEEKPDILCLQEIKARPEQLPRRLRHVDGYGSFFTPSSRKGYSGVAMYTRLEPESLRDGFGIERFDNEGRIQIADFDDFLLYNIYFPNGKMSEERLKYKLEFYDAFLEDVNREKDSGRNVVICGDLNTAHKEIDLARPRENSNVSGFLPVERAWIDKFIENGYVDTFRMFNKEPGQYTWWSYRTRARERNVGWRLDYFFVNEEFKEKVKRSWILSDVMGSDHCPIGLEIEI